MGQEDLYGGIENGVNNVEHTPRNNYGDVEAIHSHIKKIKGPTEKQLYYIEFIEHQTNIKFTGKTRKEAFKYINENKSKIFHDNYEND